MYFALKFQCLHLLGMGQMKLVAQVPREEEWEERATTGLTEACASGCSLGDLVA